MKENIIHGTVDCLCFSLELWGSLAGLHFHGVDETNGCVIVLFTGSYHLLCNTTACRGTQMAICQYSLCDTSVCRSGTVLAICRSLFDTIVCRSGTVLAICHSLFDTIVCRSGTLLAIWDLTGNLPLFTAWYHCLQGDPATLPQLAWQFVVIQVSEQDRVIDPVLAFGRDQTIYFYQVICAGPVDIRVSGLQKIQLPYKLLSLAVSCGSSFYTSVGPLPCCLGAPWYSAREAENKNPLQKNKNRATKSSFFDFEAWSWSECSLAWFPCTQQCCLSDICLCDSFNFIFPNGAQI